MLTISIIALVVSCLALPFTVWAARATARQAESAAAQTEIQREQVAAAREQTQLQRQLAEEVLQPYVWADIQPDTQQGRMLQIVVGNSGPTMAHNVRVTVDASLPAALENAEAIERVMSKLARGLRSLAPGRVIRWSLGRSADLMASEESRVLTLRVEGDGPHGSLPAFEAQIDINEWREARDAPDGSLHHVRGAVQDLTKAVSKVNTTIERVRDQWMS